MPAKNKQENKRNIWERTSWKSPFTGDDPDICIVFAFVEWRLIQKQFGPCSLKPVHDNRCKSFCVKSWCQAKFVTWEASDFMPCAHAQSSILHIKYAEKTDN